MPHSYSSSQQANGDAMSYHYEIYLPDGSSITGAGITTLHEVVEHIQLYAHGKTLYDVSINGIPLEDIGLHVIDGKMVEENGDAFVCCNKWYDLFAQRAQNDQETRE